MLALVILSLLLVLFLVAFYYFAGYFVNKCMPKIYLKQGDVMYIFLDDEYNRSATISSVTKSKIVIYDKLPLPLTYRGKFYAVGEDAVEQGDAPGDLLFLLLHRLGVVAAGPHRLPDDVPVIELDAQLLGHQLADGVAAGAVLPADGNHFVHCL